MTASPKQYLIESHGWFIPLQILEDTEAPSSAGPVQNTQEPVFKIRGEFAHAKKPTANKRFYREQLWKNSILKVEEVMKHMSLFGELDHPDDGKTKLARSSHIITKLELMPDGRLIGECLIMDTDTGRNLKAIFRAGGRPGVSSRGWGSTRPTDQGYEEVLEDYNLQSFDFVADPADNTAYPSQVFEGYRMPIGAPALKETAEKASTMQPNQVDVQAMIDAALEKQRAQLTASFQSQLADAVARHFKEERKASSLPESVPPTTELGKLYEAIIPLIPLDEATKKAISLKEEEIDRLKGVVIARESLLRERDIQLQEANTKYEELSQENAKIGRLAVVSGMRFYLEQTLIGDPDANTVRRLVGDVGAYADIDELTKKVGAVQESLDENRKERQAVEARHAKALEESRKAVEAERQRSSNELKQLREEVVKRDKMLEEALQNTKAALEESKTLKLRLHAEERTAGTPHASRTRTLMQAAHPKTQQDVDNIVEASKPIAPRNDITTQNILRQRRNANMGAPVQPAEEELPAPNPHLQRFQAPINEDRDINDTGVPLGEFKRLAGV